MSRDILITLHAGAGVISFIIGVLVLLPPEGWRASLRFLFNLFLGALTLMLALLIAVIGVDWPGLDNVQRIIFGGLSVLALYMVWRALQAYQLLRTKPEGWQLTYTAHVGFNLISLFEGFVIVGAIDLGVPGWLVGVMAVLGVFIGRWLVHLAYSRFVKLSI